jgi:hypothetical protein
MASPKTIQFLDFWPYFNPHKDWGFGEFLLKEFNLKVKMGPDPVDILVYSVFGKGHRNWEDKAKIKICYSGENLSRYNINAHDILNKGHFLIAMDRINHPNYLRLSNMVRVGFYDYSYDLVEDFTIPTKTKFCSFIQRNCSCKYRNNFVKQLSKYKKVDCLGPCLNNAKSKILSRHHSNLETIAPYKFNISFENSSSIGYCTEKIWWGFLAKTISIYWGDPTVTQDFYQGSFLNRHEYESDEEFIEAIIELDNNDDAYYEMLTKSKLKDKSIIDTDRIKKFFERSLKYPYET